MMEKQNAKVILFTLMRRWDDKAPIAIQSVLEQDYPHWECYILTTPETSLEIYAFLSTQQGRTKQFFLEIEDAPTHIEGFEMLRRKSVELARLGDYCCNFDGDDSLAPDFLSKQLQALATTPGVDIACAGIAIHTEGVDKVDTSRTISETTVFRREEFVDAFSKYDKFFYMFWGNLYASSLFTPDIFDNIPPVVHFDGKGQDTAMAFSVLKKSKGIVITTGVGYHYNLWSSGISFKYVEQGMHVPSVIYGALKAFFDSCHPSMDKTMYYRLYPIFLNRVDFYLRSLSWSHKNQRERFVAFHQIMSIPPAREAMAVTVDLYRDTHKTYYKGFYQTEFSPLQEVLSNQSSMSSSPLEEAEAFVRMFYELFLIVWVESEEVLTYDVFREKAFLRGNFQELEEGNYILQTALPTEEEKSEQLRSLLAEMERI